MGYINVDGLDGSIGQLNIAKKKNAYNEYIKFLLDKNTTLPIANDKYDAIVSTGVFWEGHLSANALPELLRILKPGIILYIFCLYIFDV